MDLDSRVRLAAFAFLEARVRLAGGETLPRELLRRGFLFEGQQVGLVGPQGIFKPAVLPDMPISILTAPIAEGGRRPYDDMMGEDGLLRYRYRGIDPGHHENVGLRLAMTRKVPLVYFHGVVPGHYMAAWPVFVVSDDPGSLTFVISVDERRFASLGSSVFDEEALVRRRYVTRLVQQRVHQESFRRRVLEAYREHCAVCRLRHDRLLEAAHILPDGHPRGEPVVTNGLALCKLHHAAFDANLLGVTPDYRVQLSEAILEEEDGPMLLHGMQGFHGRRIHVPRPARLQPSREFLEERYALFRQSC